MSDTYCVVGSQIRRRKGGKDLYFFHMPSISIAAGKTRGVSLGNGRFFDGKESL